VDRYELYVNGKLVEQYNGPSPYKEVKIGDDHYAWRYDPKVYTECGNCGRLLLIGEDCGLC
jgi:hypothetical protein